MINAWFWAGWLAVIVATFSVAEGYAIDTNQMTLSAFVWWISDAFPPFPWIAGFLTGFLCCHFWWGGSFNFFNGLGAH